MKNIMRAVEKMLIFAAATDICLTIGASWFAVIVCAFETLVGTVEAIIALREYANSEEED